MTDLVLVRHGESEHHARGLTGGWTDLPLTDRGRRQAEATGERLAGLLGGRRCALFCSDLLRAAQTAAIIGECLGLAPHATSELREFNNGAAAYLTVEQAAAIRLPVTEPLAQWFPYPDSENWVIMTRRVIAAMERIAREDCETAIVVAHAGCGVSIIHWWLGLAEEYWSRISYDLAPCSFTRLGVTEWGERSIVTLNDTCHLDGGG